MISWQVEEVPYTLEYTFTPGRDLYNIAIVSLTDADWYDGLIQPS